MSTSMRTRLAVASGKVAGKVSRITRRGEGAQISGRVALAIAPQAIGELSRGQKICLVSGTNGKSTTTGLINAALRLHGVRVASNETGANMESGFVIPLSEPADWHVIEIDEDVLVRALRSVAPATLVLTNISRDQLDRHPETTSLASKIRLALEATPGVRVIGNASDPLVVWAAGSARAIWVEVGLPWKVDAQACPACFSLLSWNDEKFSCRCGFTQPRAVAALHQNDLVFDDGRLVHLELSVPGDWNFRNAALATVALEAMGYDPTLLAKHFGSVASVGTRYSTRRLPDGRMARIIMGKNAAGWAENLTYLRGRKQAGVVIAINANSADGRDTSWLWDVPFELLRGHSVAASGERFLDISARLHYAEVEHVVEQDPMLAATMVRGDEVDILPTYSAYFALHKR
ncbi:MAG: MurT ligase domain-containing protein [Actinomycetota bacterium]